MGKDLKKELDGLQQICQAAMRGDVSILSDFLLRFHQFPLFGVGSGGSYSVAAVFKYLCGKAGWTAQCITPLELSQLSFQIQTGAAVLFTAGGSNHDSKNAYRFITELEPEGVLTCCMRENAPIKKLQKQNLHNFYFEYKMPVSKDGYLAVESLTSATILLIRAFGKAMNNPFFSLSEHELLQRPRFSEELMISVLKRDSLIILHGGITTPAAIDLESKFSEAFLGNTQTVDFRNFAHGRHFWLSDRRDSTAVIALVGHSESRIADSTLALLPMDIPVLRIDVPDGTAAGLLEAFCCVFELVLFAGMFRNMNPGKPHVEEFGKKLYHLNYNICMNEDMKMRRKNRMAMAAYRKCRRTRGSHMSEYLVSAGNYWNRLSSHSFKGLIFDYDGTLHDKSYAGEAEKTIFDKIEELLEQNVKIGIATGRGKSVRRELQRAISEKHWGDILIAYYNGGGVGTLADETQPDKRGVERPEVFGQIAGIISMLGRELEVDGLEDRNPYQLTILADGRYESLLGIRLLIERISGIPDIKIVESSHSIDIMPIGSSKKNIFKAWLPYGYEEDDFLVIGDSGHLAGNDYELLTGGYTLSVDYVSEAPDSCWNFAQPGLRNLEATMDYLNMIEMTGKGSFIIRG